MFHLCAIAVGIVQTCSATTFTGTAPVLLPTGRVYDCDVSVGEVRTCHGPHTGDAVLLRGTKYVRCSVTSGIVSRCDATGFMGTVPLER